MKLLVLSIALAIAPLAASAQPDTLAAPIVPPTPPVAPVPPMPPAPLTIEEHEATTIIETIDGAQRITVTKGDTTIIVTTRPDGETTTIVEVGGSENAKAHQLSVGFNSKEGTYVKVEDVDTTRKEPVTITTKRKIIKIYSEAREAPSDSAMVAERLKELRTERRNMFTYWSGIDVGLNTLLGPDGSTELEGDAEFMQIDNSRSRFFALNFMEQKVEFGSSNVGLLTGLGWEFTSYHLKNNVQLQYDADSVFATYVDSPEYSKNKLRQSGFRVPLMLEFNTKRAPLPSEDEIRANKGFSYDRKRNVHIAVGVVGSWYYETMYKQKYRKDGENRKDRSSGDYHLLPYRAALSARFGYGGLNLFAEYALTSLFKDGKGPELTPLNVGLTIIGFN